MDGALARTFQARDAVHKATSQPGEHKPIISKVPWDKVYGILRAGPISGLKGQTGLRHRAQQLRLFDESRHHRSLGRGLINDLGARPLAKAEQLTRAFGLTPGEAQLAAALSSGTTLQDAADELGIGNETARTRLKGVFAKTGVNRQTALIALIARLGS